MEEVVVELGMGKKVRHPHVDQAATLKMRKKVLFFEARVAALYYRGTLYRFLIVFWVFFCLKAETLYIV